MLIIMINFPITLQAEAIARTFQLKLDQKDSSIKAELLTTLILNAAQLPKRKLKYDSKVRASVTPHSTWLLAPLPPPESILTTVLAQLTQIKNPFNSELMLSIQDSMLFPTLIWQKHSKTKYLSLGLPACNRRTLIQFSGTHPKDNTRSLSILILSELIQSNRHYNLNSPLSQSTKEVPVILNPMLKPMHKMDKP